MNATSRLKLRSLADDLKLPDDLYEAALLELNKAAPDDQQLDTYERGFVKFLRAQFNNVPHRILSARMEKRAIDLAKSKFDIDKNRARELIRAEAISKGIGRISQSDAEEHVEQLCSDLIGDDRVIDEKKRERMQSAAQQWGVGKDRVKSIVDQLLKQNQQQYRPVQPLYTKSIAILATATIIAVVGAIVLWNNRLANQRKRNADDPADRQSNLVKQGELTQPVWWSGELFTELASMYVDSGGLRPILDQLNSDNPVVREKGFVELADRIVLSEDWSDKELADLRWFGLLHDREPSELVANAFFQQTIGYLRLENGKLIDNELLIKHGAQANRLAYLIFSNCSDKARQEIIGNEIAQWTDLPPDLANKKYIEAATRNLQRKYWQNLIDFGWSDSKQTIAKFETLLKHSQAIPRTELVEYQSEVLLYLLQADPGPWPRVAVPLQNALANCSIGQLRLWFNLARTTDKGVFADWILKQLVERLKVQSRSSRFSDMVAALRRTDELQTAEERQLSQRWQQWQEFESKFQGRTWQPGGKSPERIAGTAYLGTLAMILASQEWLGNTGDDRFALFDQLVQEGLPRLDRTLSFVDSAGTTIFRVVEKQATAVDKRSRTLALEKLRDFPNQRSATLVASVKSLASVASRFPDVNPGDAVALSRYFLSELDDSTLR